MRRFLTLSLLLAIQFLLLACNKRIKESRLEAIVFVAPQCPISEAILLNLNQISEEYDSNQVAIKLVVPGELYTRSEIDSFVEVNKIKHKVIIDSQAVLVKKYNATITPEVFLISGSQIIYSGAIDDRALDNEIIRQSATENYLRDAIKLTLKGEELKVKKTKAVGCYIEL